MTEWIGYLAAFLTTIRYLPQAMHVIVTRQTAGISRLAYSTLFLGIALWFLYGLLKGDWPLILCNGITLPLITVILVMKFRHG